MHGGREAVAVARRDVGSTRLAREQTRGVERIAGRGVHERRHSARVRRVDVGAGFEQYAHERRAERRRATARRRRQTASIPWRRRSRRFRRDEAIAPRPTRPRIARAFPRSRPRRPVNDFRSRDSPCSAASARAPARRRRRRTSPPTPTPTPTPPPAPRLDAARECCPRRRVSPPNTRRRTRCARPRNPSSLCPRASRTPPGTRTAPRTSRASAPRPCTTPRLVRSPSSARSGTRSTPRCRSTRRRGATASSAARRPSRRRPRTHRAASRAGVATRRDVVGARDGATRGARGATSAAHPRARVRDATARRRDASRHGDARRRRPRAMTPRRARCRSAPRSPRSPRTRERRGRRSARRASARGRCDEHAGSLQMEFVARAIAAADKTSAIVEAWLDDRSDAVGAVGVDAGEVSARVRGAATAARAGARARRGRREATRRGGRERGGVAMRQGDAKRCEWGC